jgi:hypothetical protein
LLVSVPLVTILLLVNPEIQTLTSKLAAEFLTRKIGAEVKIGYINLTYKGGFVLRDLSIHDDLGDDLLDVGKLELFISGINRRSKTVDLGAVTLADTRLGLLKQQEDELNNLAYFLQHFKAKTPDSLPETTIENPWTIRCKKLNIENSGLAYRNLAEMDTSNTGIDFKNLELNNINISMDDLLIDHDTISADINELWFTEKSGFQIKEFSGSVYFSPVSLFVENLAAKVNNSTLEFDLRLNYENMEAFRNFIDQVRMDVTFRNSTLDMSDVGYFAQTMFSMTDIIRVDGHFMGTVSDLRGEDFEIVYGNNTRLAGSLRMTGLPEITTTYIAADISRLTTDAGDLNAFQLPGNAGTIPVPDMIANAGVVDVSGRFTGYYNSFVSQLKLNTNIGRLNTDLTVRTTGPENEIAYEGKIEAKRLDVGKLLEMENALGRSSFYLNIDGTGVTPQNMRLTSEGAVTSLSFMGYDYKNITIDGNIRQQQFEGLLTMSDDNLDFTFNGLVDFNEEIPVFNFKSNVQHADLFNLKLSERDSVSVISTRLDINFHGLNPDDMVGIIRFDSTLYTEADSDYYLDSLILRSFNGDDGMRRLHLLSDIIDAAVEGKYQFSAVPAVIAEYISNYSEILPAEIDHKKLNGDIQVIDFWVNLKQTDQLSQLFAPQIRLAPDATLAGLFHSGDKKLDVEFDAGYVDVSTLRFYDARLASSSDDERFYLDFKSGRLLFSEPTELTPEGVGVDSLMLTTSFHSDSLLYSVSWSDLSDLSQYTGDIDGVMVLENRQRQKNTFPHFDLIVDGRDWTVVPENTVTFDEGKLLFEEMTFYSDSSVIDVHGAISEQETDSLHLNFRDINISTVDKILNNPQISIDGMLNGNALVTGLYSNPNFIVDLSLNDLYLNKEHLGILEIATTWNDPEGSLGVELDIYRKGNIEKSRVLALRGNYFPESSQKNFDMDVQLNNLGTQLFNPFISEFATIGRESLASGKLKLEGTNKKPVVNGKINLMRSQFHIHYLNTHYSLAGAVEVNDNRINLNELTLNDTKGRSAACSGFLNHNYFKDFTLDLTIDHNNFRMLNTTSRDNELFYGDAVATGQVHINGPFDDLTMNIIARTDNGTRIMIPISSAVSVADSDFIIFRGVEEDEDTEIQPYNVNLKGLEVNFDLEVTPSAELEIFLPFGMGNIEGVGSGDIGFSINKLGDFSIFGDYVISDGNFYFTFENLIGRDFSIREGSRISWTGDPYDATVDIHAVHSVKTNLAGLQLQTDSAALYNTRVQVECIIILQNELFNPDIRFSMDFANVPDETKEIIFTSLDTTDQSAMSQQILSLLLLGNFSYTANTPDIGATSFKLLSNQLSGWLSKLSKDFDIGISYQPGTTLTEDELEVALRTQLFNDRLSIDGNFGVRGTASSQSTSNVVGDINVEYKITQDGRFRIKAFNRTNNLTLIENNAPYTQGVGVFFRKEFEKFGDLLGAKRDKEEDRDGKDRNEEAVLESARREEEHPR